MKKNLLILIVAIITNHVFGQSDSIRVQKFKVQQEETEKRFIQALQFHEMEKCMSFFPKEIIEKYSRPELENDLNIFYSYILTSKATGNRQVGKLNNNTPPFGHMIPGSLQIKSTYSFVSENGDTTYYSLYYSNSNPNLIYFYESNRLNDLTYPSNNISPPKN